MLKPRILVVSSSKGGVGKSTVSIQIAICLIKKKKKVIILDCDIQGTASSYLKNREKYKLLSPDHRPVTKDLQEEINQLEGYDVVIIDTPGSKSAIGDEAHSLADTILTVMNDSFVDLDVLVKITDPEKYTGSMPGHYADDLWEVRKSFLYSGRKPPKWFLLLNRVGHRTKNHSQILRLVKDIAQKWGMEFIGMLRERVGYRDGFLYGKTPLDPQASLSASHVAARMEVRQLLSALGL